MSDASAAAAAVVASVASSSASAAPPAAAAVRVRVEVEPTMREQLDDQAKRVSGEGGRACTHVAMR